MNVFLKSSLVVLGLCAAAVPASAQWTRELALPQARVFGIYAVGDTILAGTDTCVFVSTDAGASWRASSKPRSDVFAIESVHLRNGHLYAGTAGQGVFTSDDLGVTWQGFNQGLVGGLFDSQLQIADLEVRGDNLYAATLGAGVYVRSLAGAGTWAPFGAVFEPNQASNVNALAVGGTRLFAAAGGNGDVYFRDPGDAEWTQSWLDNVGLEPGLQAQGAVWTGSGWVVGTNVGTFRSLAGESPWTFSGPSVGALTQTAFALRGGLVFAAFDRLTVVYIAQSGDDGATWQLLDTLPAVFVYEMAVAGNELWAARADGLWRRSTETASVPAAGGPSGLRFALAGAQPAGDVVRFRFELPEPGSASIEVFDVTGRRAAERVQGSWPAGAHELSWSARDLAPGVYQARLSAGGRSAAVRLVHIR